MNAFPSCPRKWQVEAANDGRLSGLDSSLAERHREQCRECADEARALARLQFRCANLPRLPRDPLAVRRARQELLSALNQALLAPQRSSQWAVAWTTLALLCVGASAWALFVGHRAAPTPTQASMKPALEVHAEPQARFVVHSEPGVDRAELSDGTASFEVAPHPGRRVLVSLPDGELEDLGTIFAVTVHAGKTERIHVSQGRVLVRLVDQAEFSLPAGALWQRARVPSSSPRLPSPEVASNVIPEVPRVTRAARANARAPRAQRAPSLRMRWSESTAIRRAPKTRPTWASCPRCTSSGTQRLAAAPKRTCCSSPTAFDASRC